MAPFGQNQIDGKPAEKQWQNYVIICKFPLSFIYFIVEFNDTFNTKKVIYKCQQTSSTCKGVYN